MYEVINEELGIMACDLEDLTAEQVMRFLGGWKDGARRGGFVRKEQGKKCTGQWRRVVQISRKSL